ncbi:S-adenosyl methyltransferase [Cryptosporangium aurantiacum]|uniref:S-adenosyl methyltransferase n=2 Tax=Cryptosporangium aurantiacum TaxID=134849 RepID=A0A1M7R6S3_9ACTN|nr:S-adenosyl methyltransferase [Cryptosporangium aurantiacum]
MYDYYLGGSHNFASDREMARRALALFPDGQLAAQANRAFLHRGVRYLRDQGIRQFLDLGSGIPTMGNVHEIADDATVVYVDLDPVAVAHSEAILADVDRAGIVHADIRRPQDVLESPVTRQLLDFTQPVGLLMVAVLHFIGSDDEAAGIVGTFRDALPTGSGLVLAHATLDSRPDEMKRIEEVYKASANPATTRSYGQIERFLNGWDVIDPGLIWAVQWKPDWPDAGDRDPSWCGNYGAVGWKR